jgi:20S proteasome subunit beta 7
MHENPALPFNLNLEKSHPSVTGTSVLGVAFDGGVLIAADVLGSYGSMAKLRHLPRVFKVNDSTVIAGHGDYADMQFLNQIIEDRVRLDECLNDGYFYKPKSLFSWCTRVLYNRRSKMDPLWNRLVIGGMQDGEP